MTLLNATPESAALMNPKGGAESKNKEAHDPAAAAYCALPQKSREAVDVIVGDIVKKFEKSLPKIEGVPSEDQLAALERSKQTQVKMQLDPLLQYLNTPKEKLGRDPAQDVIKMAEKITKGKKAEEVSSPPPIYSCANLATDSSKGR